MTNLAQMGHPFFIIHGLGKKGAPNNLWCSFENYVKILVHTPVYIPLGTLF